MKNRHNACAVPCLKPVRPKRVNENVSVGIFGKEDLKYKHYFIGT